MMQIVSSYARGCASGISSARHALGEREELFLKKGISAWTRLKRVRRQNCHCFLCTEPDLRMWGSRAAELPFWAFHLSVKERFAVTGRDVFHAYHLNDGVEPFSSHANDLRLSLPERGINGINSSSHANKSLKAILLSERDHVAVPVKTDACLCLERQGFLKMKPKLSW
eukprot:jgi/Botrbrau1/13237/Bobra.0199s0009.1